MWTLIGIIVLIALAPIWLTILELLWPLIWRASLFAAFLAFVVYLEAVYG